MLVVIKAPRVPFMNDVKQRQQWRSRKCKVLLNCTEVDWTKCWIFILTSNVHSSVSLTTNNKNESFLSFFPSYRCLSDNQQLLPLWPPAVPRHNHMQSFYTEKTSLWRDAGKTPWNTISYLRWISYNDTHTEIPECNNVFPAEIYTTAQVKVVSAWTSASYIQHSAASLSWVCFLLQVNSFKPANLW